MAYTGDAARHYAARRTPRGMQFEALAAWEPLNTDLDDIQFVLWWLALLPARDVTGRPNVATAQALMSLARQKNLLPPSDFVRTGNLRGGAGPATIDIDSRLSPLLGKELARAEALPEGERELLRGKLRAGLSPSASLVSTEASLPPGQRPSPAPTRTSATERWYEGKVLGMPMPVAIGGGIILLAGLAALAFRRKVVPNGAMRWHAVESGHELLIDAESVASIIPVAGPGDHVWQAWAPASGDKTFRRLGDAKAWVERQIKRVRAEEARYGEATHPSGRTEWGLGSGGE